MAELPIVRLGHPALRTPAQAVGAAEIESPDFQTLIDDMVETMRSAAGVGLAAPQVAVGLQLFVFAAAADPPIPLTVAVNPMLTPEPGELVHGWEGCLSIPGLRGLVPRHLAVRLAGLDREGRPFERRLEGFAARITQHEFDHLNGVIFLDRMRDLRSLCFEEEWQRYLVPDGSEPEDRAVE